MAVIEVTNMTKDYGHGRGVFDISFSIGEGEVFGFLGPNGAGKSTTIRHLMGFSKPDKGETKIFDLNTFQKYHKILQHVGYIPGEIALPSGITGFEFIKMMQDLQGIKNDERLNMLLKLFEVDPSGETKRMSLGVKRKLAIVVAFMHDPKVLILDEPTSGLDPVMQKVFIDFIKEEKRRGKTILLSSHIFTEVDATCDRIAIIKDGHIMSNFVADDLRHKTLKNYLLEFKTKKDFEAFKKAHAKSKKIKVFDDNLETKTLKVSVDDKNINELIKEITNYNLSNFVHLKETLEDYFMSYYKEDKVFEGGL